MYPYPLFPELTFWHSLLTIKIHPWWLYWVWTLCQRPRLCHIQNTILHPLPICHKGVSHHPTVSRPDLHQVEQHPQRQYQHHTIGHLWKFWWYYWNYQPPHLHLVPERRIRDDAPPGQHISWYYPPHWQVAQWWDDQVSARQLQATYAWLHYHYFHHRWIHTNTHSDQNCIRLLILGASGQVQGREFRWKKKEII